MRKPSILALLGGLLVVGACVIAGVGVTSALTGRDSSRAVLTSTHTMESRLLLQAVIVEGHGPGAVKRFDRLSREFDVALAKAMANTREGSAERAALVTQAGVATRWHAAAVRELAGPNHARPAAVAQRQRLLYRFARENASLRERLLSALAAIDRRGRRAMLFVIVSLAALAAAGGGVMAVRRWRRRSADATRAHTLLLEDRNHRRHQEEFTRALQGARTEREAYRMLKSQLERSFSGGSATVFNRNNSEDRLEAVTSLRADSPIAEAVPDAQPEDCLAVRFGQPQKRDAGTAPLLPCELCGGLKGAVTCVPSLVGGEVIGSVLVETPDSLNEDGHRRLADAVSHAAPVLASMRNLRLAETRAATDTLTGLPNRRAAEDTLKLMLANADRGATPCAVGMFDLDHFKQVNDVYGHEKGDHLLAAVSDAASSSIRASDFVARFGGEEFLVVLPNTDLEGAVLVCDKIREAISALRVAGLGQSPSASFGVTVFPADGAEPEGLLRGADRALYAAKAAGRNCVKTMSELDAEMYTAEAVAEPIA